MTVEWYHNGYPLANGHRFRKTHDFGYVSLDILYAFPEDSGEWTCVATNSLGEAQSSASFNVIGNKVIYDESQHPESLHRIQQIEAPKELPPEPVELKPLAPQFISPLQTIERIEGQPAHFETRVTPINDPQMRVQWFKDGAPLLNSNRFHHTSDFGFIGLDIAYTVPEDSGVYTVVAANEQGQDQTEGYLGVESKSVFRISLFPVLMFHNGRPLAASSRIAMRNEFGLVTLDIHYVLPEDVGEFCCLARNAAGEDQTTGSLHCQSRASILGDVQHPESWKRIQACFFLSYPLKVFAGN
ncbi:unnamed protein product [Gongylonema pulchrum]|uniref:Ig-like domain-containing protein n=1 Tax=Gongylonema pulchrum TaxID=637853 RepID=A0A3P7RM49_9BILA|nr:unnamed protein product [Gongylonema pulchrum]